ncbi:NADP-dependent phosphogluconate dehydrogenase [Fundidesulfovibrio soli]|uniref:NADP-dependent phosphogluconate dehydrogenase n=1 Tax=Fundidesulfovibrio soli TaxID=2922716 RepID=UPI001FB02621|nr:NADP-dependent phosphogluconate dehydrogenase [Fundidesulfovibrio soli]
MSNRDIALIGLAVMGQNLALNMAGKGFSVTVHNRTASVTHEFMERAGTAAGLRAEDTLAGMVATLARPRKVFLMVKAGSAVDHVIDELAPLLEPGDIIVDGGNSHYRDTELRAETLAAKGLHYLGVGVSGGEEGALRGPSIMPGGDRDAYALLEPILTAIAARADGEPCVGWMGKGGAGHFVKMVHNGIEYGDMQLIAEAYDILGRAGGLEAGRQAEVYARWNEGPLASYLVDITSQVLARTDKDTGKPLVDMVLDEAEQKGTGRWTAESALELGVPVPTLTAAVEARNISAMKTQRVRASRLLAGPAPQGGVDVDALVADMEQALYAAKVCSYAQGFSLLAEADRRSEFGLELGLAAKVWRAGCIIRAAFLDDIAASFRREPGLDNLLLAREFTGQVESRIPALRRIVGLAVAAGIPVPALGASLSYFDGYRSGRLPANLIQAQRDCFGAHTFKRTDREGVFHADWSSPAN